MMVRVSRVLCGGLLAGCLWLVVMAAGTAASAIAAGPPVIADVAVEEVGPTVATLRAHVLADAYLTVYRFEYGVTTTYGNAVFAHQEISTGGEEDIAVSSALGGLSPNTAYHYRLVATNPEGVAVSEDHTFTTFGVTSFHVTIENADGTPDQQAGSHPYEVLTSFTYPANDGASGEAMSAGAKDVEVELPPGLIGNAEAIPRCPRSLLASAEIFGSSRCPPDTQVGLMRLKLATIDFTLPIYNLVPPAGLPAQLGAFALLFPVIMNVAVHTGGGQGTTISLTDLSQLLPVTGTSLALWGVPADPAHDRYRGKCVGFEGTSTGFCPTEAPLTPFITLPTECGSPLALSASIDSWVQPGYFVNITAPITGGAGEPIALTGCDRLVFKPSIGVGLDNGAADAPIGMTVDVAMPQSEGGELGEASLREAVVTLPDGVSINPSSADGLVGCPPPPVPSGEGVPSTCPDASKIGRAEVTSPLLAEPITGSIHLAQPANNPFGAQLAAYMIAGGDGVSLQIPLQIFADPLTGRLSISLSRLPELPFSHFRLELDGGPRAALASPARCGTFATTAKLTPYSAPESGPPSILTSPVTVTAACGYGFSPRLVAGATSAAAGHGTGVVLRVERGDGDQYLNRLTTTMPAGLLGDLTGVPVCPADDASTGDCSTESRIGSVTAIAGAGSHPFHLTGSVFLTGPYRNAPFGLALVLPGTVGPLNLGTTVVRAQVSLAPDDLHMTIQSDQLPQVVDGIPLRLRAIALDIDRSNFLFNPTSCSTGAVGATVESNEGASVTLDTPFRVTGCSGLSFSPKLTARTQAPASSVANGASLRMNVTLLGRHRANIRSLSVTLHGALHPRLTTIRQACPVAVFSSDLRRCPPGSVVGRAAVRTPVLASPLEGAVYLVFRGGLSYPNLIVRLAGDGVSAELEGVVTISPSRLITVAFKSLPDVPMDTLTLDMPRSPNSMLGALGDICKSPPSLDYSAVGYNGARIKHFARIAVKGCGRRSSKR
jgi:hypothetical protein